MKNEENKIQESIINALRLYYPDSLCYAIPNGGKRNAREAAMLKRQGVTAGVCDLHFIHKGQIIFFEVKSEYGTLTLLQDQFRKLVEKNGFKFFVVRSAAETLKIIESL